MGIEVSTGVTVVEAEFEIINRVFIPYNWVNIPWHPFNLNEVAAGDDRDFSPALEGTYRVEQKVTVVPFKELSAERMLDYSKSPGLSIHYHEDDVFNFNDGAEHSENTTLQPSYIESDAEILNSGEAGVENVNANILEDVSSDELLVIELAGAATEPLVEGAQAIDWIFNVGVEIEDVLAPNFIFSGLLDGFPAYEVYIFPKRENALVTEILNWSPNIEDGVLKLFGGADISAGDPIREAIDL